MTAGGPRDTIEAPSSPPATTSLLATLNALGRLDGNLATTGGDAQPQVDGDGRVVGGAEARWVDGVDFDPDYCSGSHLFDPCESATADFDDVDCPDVRGFDPYIITALAKRSTLARGVDVDAQARRLLARCQHGDVGAEFWSGNFATRLGYDNGFLASSSAEQIADGVSLAALDALAALEEALAGTSSYACGCGARGMIHAAPTTAVIWAYQGVLANVNGLLVTTLGTVVATGPGYTGTGPAGSDGPIDPAEGFAWAYATGMPAGRLGAVQLLDSVDSTTNVRYVQAERAGMVIWDGCCHVAVLVDHAQRD